MRSTLNICIHKVLIKIENLTTLEKLTFSGLNKIVFIGSPPHLKFFKVIHWGINRIDKGSKGFLTSQKYRSIMGYQSSLVASYLIPCRRNLFVTLSDRMKERKE